ncbi:MAG TPA: hypothetical protein VGC09_08185 [Rhodopila sp.]
MKRAGECRVVAIFQRIGLPIPGIVYDGVETTERFDRGQMAKLDTDGHVGSDRQKPIRNGAEACDYRRGIGALGATVDDGPVACLEEGSHQRLRDPVRRAGYQDHFSPGFG